MISDYIEKLMRSARANATIAKLISAIEPLVAKIKARRRITLAICVGVLAFWALPPNTLDPFCTYRSQYRLDAVLQVGNELLASTVFVQESHSRHWVSQMNSAGCVQRYGKALSFRSLDDRVFLIHSDICRSVEQLSEFQVDVIEHCSRNWPNEPIGFIVDNATKPTTWKPFNFLKGDQDVKLVSMKASPTLWHPSDDLQNTAPNILKSSFATNNPNGWWNSPERILNRRRGNNIKFHVRMQQPDSLGH